MENAQLIGLSRQVTLRRQLDVIANNIANMNTNGFKGQSLLFEETELRNAKTNPFPRPDRPPAFVIDDRDITNFEAGSIVTTGNPTDVAINGAGFFVIETPAGERFTRDGGFQIDNQGRLVTASGFPVLSDGGPVIFGPEETNITVARDGTVSSSAGARGRLRVVEFETEQLPRQEGGNLFAGENPVAVADPRLVQGALEKSNVKSVTELAAMIRVQRSYESVTNWMKNADELRRTAIERLSGVQA
jgi:flagellar basal-body rod protein FlgF